LIQPFLDSQAGFKHQTGEVEHFLTLDQAIRLTRDAFTGAAERDIYTGDGLEIFVIKKGEGVSLLKFDLKQD
jgi:20S proteasome subunit beta 6